MCFIEKPICYTVTTDAGTGLGSISIKMSGTYNGLTQEVSNGFFLTGIDFFTDVGVNGDRVYDIKIEDVDNVIPVNDRSPYPNYPVIKYFYDENLVETSNLFKGLWVKPNLITQFKTPTNLTCFISSGLYLKATVKSTGATVFRANIHLNKSS